MFHKWVLHCHIYSTSSLTHILQTQKYQCKHLKNKRNYTVYKTAIVKTACKQLMVGSVFSIIPHLCISLD